MHLNDASRVLGVDHPVSDEDPEMWLKVPGRASFSLQFFIFEIQKMCGRYK